MLVRRLLSAALLAATALGSGVVEAAPAAPVPGQNVSAVSCSPRPRVSIRSEPPVLAEQGPFPGQDALGVTVTTSGIGNGVKAIHFTATSNALVQVDLSGAYFSPYQVTYAAGGEPALVRFTLWRPNRNQSSVARLVVTDACGDWTTFVGRGAGSR
jgi:hypothetical protein